VGFRPGSIVLVTNQGNTASLTVLINPNAEFSVDANFNGDAQVDGADLAVWQVNFGTQSGAALMQGDADGDGDVDGADFLAWQQQVEASSGPVLAVCEPATVNLAVIIIAGLIVRRSPLAQIKGLSSKWARGG
jgi:hypothetical protein